MLIRINDTVYNHNLIECIKWTKTKYLDDDGFEFISIVISFMDKYDMKSLHFYTYWTSISKMMWLMSKGCDLYELPHLTIECIQQIHQKNQ